jgi:hypothetical protein
MQARIALSAVYWMLSVPLLQSVALARVPVTGSNGLEWLEWARRGVVPVTISKLRLVRFISEITALQD